VSASTDPDTSLPESYPIVVLISGSGSNLQAIIDARDTLVPGLEIRLVISNEPGVYGLKRADDAGIPTKVINHRDFADRNSFESALITAIDEHSPALVVLAGFMRILNPGFVNHYAGRLVNIHPSLLPRYPGLHTHKRAIENGDGEAGASVHFVVPEVDGGPVIIQGHVPVNAGDTPEQLAGRVLELEHVIYPRAIKWLAEGRLTIRDGDVMLDGTRSDAQHVQYDET
jgi:phosphoribosylglycinamide formyltransferase-1